jgi:hypothetical protein
VSRPPATDEAGRPIVAELGRAETPEETAERRAAARSARRSNQTALNLVVALVASLGIVALLVLVVVRPDPPRNPVDYLEAARAAQAATDETLAAPVLPDTWGANRAEFEQGPADGVDRWEVGFLTAGGDYIGLVQGIDANPSWVAEGVADARSTGTVRIGGLEWTVYDRRTADDPGNLAYALVTTSETSTIILGGTASDDEFAVLADAVARSVTR